MSNYAFIGTTVQRIAFVFFVLILSSAQADTDIVFGDDFEAYQSKTFPSSAGWSLKYSGASSQYQYIDNTYAVSGLQSLHLVGSSCWAATAIHEAKFPPHFTLEATVLVDQIVSCGCTPILAQVGPYNPNIGSWGTVFGDVTFNCDGKIYAIQSYGDRSKDVLLLPYNPRTWYHVKMDVDLNKKAYDVYIDGVLRGSGLKIYDNGTPTNVVLAAGHGGYPTAWFDDVKVMDFNILVAPSGTIDDPTPTYRWRAVPNATWYYLRVNDASGNRIKQWYTAAQVGCESGSGECAVTPTVALQAGAGQWWIQPYGASGYGPWSAGLNFTVLMTSSAAVLIAPNGAINTATPTYRWQAAPNATWYYLWVNDASGNRIKQWYTAAQVGCASGSSECTITLTVPLQGGTGQCWVQSYSASGYGSWNSGCRIDYATPTYRWQAVTGATWYYLWVNDVSGNRIQQWYTATQLGCASGSGECAVTPTVALRPGAAQWWVQAYGPGGYGPWSQGLSFFLQ